MRAEAFSVQAIAKFSHMPRRSAAEAQKTREAIVQRVADLATVEGLEGVTVGRLAADLEMSKAGVMGHFGSKQALQLAAIEEGERIFRRRVWDQAEPKRPGLRRLRALISAWLDYLADTSWSGGCLLTAAASEFDGRSGPIAEAIAAQDRLWNRILQREAKQAIEASELAADTDAERLVFQLRALALMVNHDLQLHGDERVVKRARAIAKGLLAGN